MIIGVDRSGDESNFPIVYVAVRCKNYRILENVRRLLAKRDKRKAKKRIIKAKDLSDEELAYIRETLKENYESTIITSRDYYDFRRSHPELRKAEQKLAFENYLETLSTIVREGDRIEICRDFDEQSMSEIIDKLRTKLREDVIIGFGKTSDAVSVADLIAGAIRRNLKK